jgi:hypothetical protein
MSTSQLDTNWCLLLGGKIVGADAPPRQNLNVSFPEMTIDNWMLLTSLQRKMEEKSSSYISDHLPWDTKNEKLLLLQKR